MILGCVVGFLIWVTIIGLILIVKASNLAHDAEIIADAVDKIAEALCDEHDWKVEDRMNRTIDDLPPYVETKGP